MEDASTHPSTPPSGRRSGGRGSGAAGRFRPGSRCTLLVGRTTNTGSNTQPGSGHWFHTSGSRVPFIGGLGDLRTRSSDIHHSCCCSGHKVLHVDKVKVKVKDTKQPVNTEVGSSSAPSQRSQGQPGTVPEPKTLEEVGFITQTRKLSDGCPRSLLDISVCGRATPPEPSPSGRRLTGERSRSLRLCAAGGPAEEPHQSREQSWDSLGPRHGQTTAERAPLERRSQK